MTQPTPTLWTIGHSTRAWEVFVSMLTDAGITALVDVRRFAGSRRHPQFSAEAMARTLPEAGIAYLPVPELGGRRTPRADTTNIAWRSAGFRGYADYMETQTYCDASARLAQLAQAQRTAILCAEALWWQCHRSLIADDFKARGWEVMHLLAPGRSDAHPFTAAARVVEGKLDYGSAHGDERQGTVLAGPQRAPSEVPVVLRGARKNAGARVGKGQSKRRQPQQHQANALTSSDAE